MAAEKIVLAANSLNSSMCILWPTVVMGPGDHESIPPIHASIVECETPFIITSADNLRDINYGTDAHVLAVENLLSNNPISAGEILFVQNNPPDYIPRL